MGRMGVASRDLIPALVALSLVACGKGLSGTYVKCIPLNTTSSQQATYVFPDSSNFSYQLLVFPNLGCAGTASPQPMATGTYVEASSSVSNAQDITYSFASGNQNGTTLYQIFNLDGHNLFLGDTTTGNGSSDALRPTALETTPYVKQ
jgi:hypothetical protein